MKGTLATHRASQAGPAVALLPSIPYAILLLTFLVSAAEGVNVLGFAHIGA